uniref:Uncharacterized protein n=1 Tax=Avena sativa TaxID=4498 RepID=A0ACD6ASX0_AVESA
MLELTPSSSVACRAILMATDSFGKSPLLGNYGQVRRLNRLPRRSNPSHRYHPSSTTTSMVGQGRESQQTESIGVVTEPLPRQEVSKAGYGLPASGMRRKAIMTRKDPKSISRCGPAAPWVVQPQRAAASALGPEFRRARSTKNISKRNNRGPGAQDRGGRASSAAAGRCVDKLLRVAPEDRRALGVSLSSFRGELVSPDDYCHVLRELGDRDKSAPRALEVFHAALPLVGNGSVDKGKLLTAAIGALGKMGRPDLARRAFETGIAGGYGKTVFAYSALISAYARSGLANEAMGVLESMKGAGLRPTTVTYNAVIDACGKGGVDLRFTLGYFRQMLRDGLCPDRKTFNSLLSACSRAGHLEDARAVFDEMIHLGIGRDIYTYNTFIDAICKCGNIELAMQVLLDMEAKKVKPNVVTYSTLIDGYSKLEKYDEALKLYEKMKSLGIKLDRVCYNTVLSIYVKTGKYGEIAIVCDEMEDSGIEKDTVTYNSLINGYGKQGRLDIVSFLVQDMRRRGVAPSVLTYSTLIDIYSKAGMHVDAFNVYLDFKESGLKPDVVLFSSFIDTLAKNGLVEWALSLLNDMTEMGIKPNVVTYNTIIDAYGKSKVLAEEDPEVGDMGIVGLCNGQIIRAANPVTRGRSAIDVRMRRSQEFQKNPFLSPHLRLTPHSNHRVEHHRESAVMPVGFSALQAGLWVLPLRQWHREGRCLELSDDVTSSPLTWRNRHWVRSSFKDRCEITQGRLAIGEAFLDTFDDCTRPASIHIQQLLTCLRQSSI